MRRASIFTAIGIAALLSACRDRSRPLLASWTPASRPPPCSTRQLVAQGKRIFRFDTFGDETFWTDTLKLHG